MGNSTLVWWLLGAPVVLAIIDRFMIGGSSAMGSRGSATASSR